MCGKDGGLYKSAGDQDYVFARKADLLLEVVKRLSQWREGVHETPCKARNDPSCSLHLLGLRAGAFAKISPGQEVFSN